MGFVRSLALDVAKSGVTVNAACSGFVDTELTDGSVARIVEKTGRSEQVALDEFTGQILLGRRIVPEEEAATVTLLCSGAASGGTRDRASVAGGEV